MTIFLLCLCAYAAGWLTSSLVNRVDWSDWGDDQPCGNTCDNWIPDIPEYLKKQAE